MITEQQLLEIGFFENDRIVIKQYILDIGRGRFLSLMDVGTPNEMLFIYEVKISKVRVSEENPTGEKKSVEELICLHNYDYDGYLSYEKLKTLVQLLNKNQK